jgi:small-conductance mechanosensitive channel
MIKSYFTQATDFIMEWVSKPETFVQFGILIVIFGIAVFLTRFLTPIITRFLQPKEGGEGYIYEMRLFAIKLLPLLLPVIAFVILATSESIFVAITGAGSILALGKRFFLFLAVYIFSKRIVTDTYIKLLFRYVLIPLAFLNVVGLLWPIIGYLDGLSIEMGTSRFSALTLIQAAVVGIFLYWLGNRSNQMGQTYIRSQEEIRPPTRELMAKTLEAAIWIAVGYVMIKFIGLDLSTLAIFGGALGVGLGFGLQKIASNFISGIILLLEGEASVGDFITMDNGEEGTIKKMGARATFLETFDGKWIVVPNEDFITTRLTNWSDSGSANRFEVDFSVPYDIDIRTIPSMIEAAVAKHPKVLSKPEMPDCELRGFGNAGIDFAVEFWVDGLDDGKNKFSSDILFIVWETLRENGIQMPVTQHEIKVHNVTPAGSAKPGKNKK